MPAKSKAQQRLAGMSLDPEGRKKLGKKAMPKKVAKHYTKMKKGCK